MEYKYPPIYKYGTYLVLVYTFIKYQCVMPVDKILFNTVAIVTVLIALDYIIIKNQPFILDKYHRTDKKYKTHRKPVHVDTDTDTDGDNDSELDDDDVEKIIESCDEKSSSSKHSKKKHRKQND